MNIRYISAMAMGLGLLVASPAFAQTQQGTTDSGPQKQNTQGVTPSSVYGDAQKQKTQASETPSSVYGDAQKQKTQAGETPSSVYGDATKKH